MHLYDKLFIGGQWEKSSGTTVLDVRSPHSEELIGQAPSATVDDIDRAVLAARQAFDLGPWPRLPMAERAKVIRRFKDRYVAGYEEMTSLLIEEMGMPSWLFTEVSTAGEIAALDWLLAAAERFEVEEARPGLFAPELLIRREPVGVVGAIVPWNRPQIMIMAKAISALLVGCTVVIKASPETPLDALQLGEMFADIGLPEGVVSILPADPEVSEHLVEHPDVDMIAFTGSSATGRRIATLCGAQLKRCVLELGGKSAAIVLDDADLDVVTQGLKYASLANNGQGCVLQTRILASERRYDEVVDAISTMASSLPVGDPASPDTYLGPLISQRQQARVNGYIKSGQDEGARVVVGGTGMPDGLDRGWYVKPTVFADVTNDMRIAREEIFGPVLSVIRYEDAEDAIRIANDSDYGLAGTVWTGDPEYGLEVARRVRAGTYGVNWYTIDLGGPFGGFKSSGIGREFGPEPLNEFIEMKTVLPAPS